jgi:hypothetical protein
MNFHPVNQIDERFINKEPVVPMIRGAQSVSKNTVQVVGQPNTSNLNWNFPITSGVCTDLDWYGTYVLNFSILVTNNTGAGIAAGAKLLTYGTNMCVADYPVASLITNLNCKLNEQQLMNYNVSDYKNMLLRLGDHNKVVGEAVCPAMIETGFANYNDSYLTRNNPMASYSDASFGSGEIPNGAWGAICAIDNTSNTVVAAGLNDGVAVPVNVTVTINEPIVSAPFLFQHLQKHSEASPYYLRNVIINMALSTVASRFFRFGGPDITPAGVAGKTITSVTLTSVSSALINYFTLSAPLVKGFSLPEKSVIKAFDIVTSSVVGTPFAAGTPTKKLTLSNQSLSGLPRYIVLGCRPELNTYDPTNATWYYPIQTLTVTLGNNQNILAEYNIVDLYRASVRNGLKQDYISFSGIGSSVSFATGVPAGGLSAVSVAVSKPVQTCSSPIILEIGEDITLPFDVVNGSQGNFNFTFNVVCQNTEAPNAAGVGQGTNAPSLFFMALYDTYFSTDSKTLMSSIARSLISPDLALEVKENVQEHEVPQSADSEVGGALNKMKSAGYASNVSKSSAVSRLSKRLVH